MTPKQYERLRQVTWRLRISWAHNFLHLHLLTHILPGNLLSTLLMLRQQEVCKSLYNQHDSKIQLFHSLKMTFNDEVFHPLQELDHYFLATYAKLFKNIRFLGIFRCWDKIGEEIFWVPVLPSGLFLRRYRCSSWSRCVFLVITVCCISHNKMVRK